MDLEIDGVSYRTGTLNAKQQFHIARRILPIIAKLGTMTPVNGAEEPDTGRVLDFFTIVADGLSHLSDADCDYIMAACLGVVQRQQGDRYFPVWNKQADAPQFQDMKLPALTQLTMAVIQDNLGDFMLAPSADGSQQSPLKPNTP